MTPQWFEAALADEPGQHSVDVAGTRIAYRHWQNPGAPGLVFLHGHAAHARWWDFIAPAFHGKFDIIAIDRSGSGDSGHRDAYTVPLFASEVIKCLESAGLDRPHLVGHSFGGTVARITAYLHPGALRSLVLVDSMIPQTRGDRTPPPMPRQRTRYYPSVAEAARRFRLRPPQPCANQYILDYIARHSVRETADGYIFKLDPAVFARMPTDNSMPPGTEMIASLALDKAMIYGRKSRFFPPGSEDLLIRLFGKDRVIGIPDAHHHVFLDQPLAFISALDNLLEGLNQ